jgi:protein SCO1/2
MILALAAAVALTLHGTVLQVGPGNSIVVHHDPFGGMPSMTMPFSVPAGTAVHPGDAITATVDESTDPWSLSNIRVAKVQAQAVAVHQKPLGAGDSVPHAVLTDASGRTRSLATLSGHAYALTFIYTRCRDGSMCPLVSAKFRTMQPNLPAGARLIEVSLDPYDTPAVLRDYAKSYGAGSTWEFFTGPEATVAPFAERFGILARRTDASTIVHSERLAIVDKHGTIARFFDGANWATGEALAALKAAQAAN